MNTLQLLVVVVVILVPLSSGNGCNSVDVAEVVEFPAKYGLYMEGTPKASYSLLPSCTYYPEEPQYKFHFHVFPQKETKHLQISTSSGYVMVYQMHKFRDPIWCKDLNQHLCIGAAQNSLLVELKKGHAYFVVSDVADISMEILQENKLAKRAVCNKDGFCSGLENCANCEEDCTCFCGDTFCTDPETCDTCPEDCSCGSGTSCSDGTCLTMDDILSNELAAGLLGSQDSPAPEIAPNPQPNPNPAPNPNPISNNNNNNNNNNNSNNPYAASNSAVAESIPTVQDAAVQQKINDLAQVLSNPQSSDTSIQEKIPDLAQTITNAVVSATCNQGSGSCAVSTSVASLPKITSDNVNLIPADSLPTPEQVTNLVSFIPVLAAIANVKTSDPTISSQIATSILSSSINIALTIVSVIANTALDDSTAATYTQAVSQLLDVAVSYQNTAEGAAYITSMATIVDQGTVQALVLSSGDSGALRVIQSQIVTITAQKFSVPGGKKREIESARGDECATPYFFPDDYVHTNDYIMSTRQYNLDPYAIYTKGDQQAFATTVGVTMYDINAVKDAIDQKKGIYIAIGLNSTQLQTFRESRKHKKEVTPKCVYWDEIHSKWQSHGCKFARWGNRLRLDNFENPPSCYICHCSHLTDLSVLLGGVGAGGNEGTGPVGFDTSNKELFVIQIISAALVAFWILFVVVIIVVVLKVPALNNFVMGKSGASKRKMLQERNQQVRETELYRLRAETGDNSADLYY